MDNQFVIYCKNGDIDNIKKISLKNCNLGTGFRWACDKGHYDIVQYLVELYKTGPIYKPINIHAFKEFSFDLACMNGHYSIVRYLVTLYRSDPTYKPINIHVDNETGFRWAYANRHHNIVRYLMSLYKKHDYMPIKNYLIVFKKFDKYLL